MTTAAAPCTLGAPPELLICGRGCGFATSAEPNLEWGPWRMQVHFAFGTGGRCPRPIPGVGGTHLSEAELRNYPSKISHALVNFGVLVVADTPAGPWRPRLLGSAADTSAGDR